MSYTKEQKIKYSVALEKLLKDSNVTVGEISNHECYDTNFSYNTGASKFAILDDCFDNNVIKIPFSYDDEAEYECNASQSFVNQCDGCCDECEYGCLNDLLQDYCLLETEVYERAEEAGLDFLFAKEELLLEDDGYSVYIQEKVDGQRPVSNPDTYSQNIADIFDTSWAYNAFVIAVYNCYGHDICGKLIDFIEENGINDLHTGNWGYSKEGKPIAFDYSGFNS